MRVFVTIIVVWAGLMAVSHGSAHAGVHGVGRLSLPEHPRQLGLYGGGFVFLPRMGVGWGYDSNVFYAGDNQWETPRSAQLLLIRPGVAIRNRAQENLSVEVSGSAELRRYVFGSELAKRHSNVAGEAGIRLHFFRRSTVSIALTEHFRRTLDRRNIESARDFNRHINRAGAAVTFAPGGRAFRLVGSYHFVADLFTDTDNDWGDLVYHDVRIQGVWRFLPFTSAVLDTRWQVRRYLAEGQGHHGELGDSSPLWVRAGLSGFFTPKLSLSALVGWGHSFHEGRSLTALERGEEQAGLATLRANDSYNGPLAEASVGFRFDPTTLVQLAYTYSFRDSLFANYVRFHRIGLSGDKRIAGRVDLSLGVAYSHLIHGQVSAETLGTGAGDIPDIDRARGMSTKDRIDALLEGTLKASVDINRFLAFELAYRMTLLNEMINEGGNFYFSWYRAGVEQRDYVGFSRHWVFGSLVVRY